MSLLTETLNRIRAWIEKNHPENLVAIPPGLQLSQIQEMVEILPFKLPNEVYELYQWSCGIDEETSCDFYSFMIPFEEYVRFTAIRILNVFMQYSH